MAWLAARVATALVRGELRARALLCSVPCLSAFRALRILGVLRRRGGADGALSLPRACVRLSLPTLGKSRHHQHKVVTSLSAGKRAVWEVLGGGNGFSFKKPREISTGMGFFNLLLFIYVC